ncbi:MAG TPA: hypothetical protein VIY29_28455 [Ktedonobacteraceae bacterium]
MTLTSRAGSVIGYAEFGLAAGGLPGLVMSGFALAGFSGRLPGGRLAACLHGRCLGVIDGKYLGQACRFQDAADLAGRHGQG